MPKNTLIVIAGPTAVGKTVLASELALRLNTVILSADSRQFYREMNIGTAKPDQQTLSRVKHYFVGNLSIHDYYNVSRYEQDVLSLLPLLFVQSPFVVMAGGSGLYIDAVCNGIDDFPDPDPQLRKYLKGILADEGIEKLKRLLLDHDPHYYHEVDLANPARIMRALEVSMTTGNPFSHQRKNTTKERDFRILKIGLDLPREELFERIHRRVDQMMANGLADEARNLLPFRHLNALNTVGYKEIFEYFDGKISLEQAVTDIKTNTRRYAKRQLTWFRRDAAYRWFSPLQPEEVLDYITHEHAS